MKPARHTLAPWLNGNSLRILLFVAILIAGALGWQLSPAANPPPSGLQAWCDAVYRSLQLFSLNYDHPSDATWHPDWLLNVSRFVAPVFLAIAIITRLSGHVRNGFLYAWHALPWAGPQYLIIGYGRIGQGLAAALTVTGARVVAVDHRLTPLDQQSARLAGIELYQADAQDLNSFKNVPVRLAAMKRIFVSVNNDQQTIATAAGLAEQIGTHNGSVWMQLNDWTLLDRLRNSSVLAEDKATQRKIRSFSMAEALGTQLVAQYRPALMAGSFGQNRLHAVLVRFDDFVWAMAEALILNGTTPPPRLARPRLTIIDAQAEALAARWQARHPHLHQWADIGFQQTDPSALAWSAEADQLTRIETLDPPTLYIFGRSGDGDSLSDALALRHGMEKGLRQPAPVFLTTEVQGVRMFDLRENCENLQDRLHVIGDDAETVAYSHVVDPWFEHVALRFFKKYNFKDQKVDDEEAQLAYEGKPETMQVSNRRAAVHAVQILAWLGFEQVKAERSYFGLTATAAKAFKTLLSQNVPGKTSTYLESWGLYEHLRWCVDRAIDGWRLGARDNESRFRDQMDRGRYDYEELSGPNKKLDYDQAEDLADLLTEPQAEKLWFRHDETKAFIRIVDHEQPLQLRWYFADGELRLQLDDHQSWPAPPESPGLYIRVRLLVPIAPVLIELDDDKKKYVAMRPVDQKPARVNAYRHFITTLPCDLTAWLQIRFTRVAAEGWEWLPKDISPAEAWFDGCTLPPLTIGFAGARDLTHFGGEEAVKPLMAAKIRAVLQEQSGYGRQLRLITGVAKGADLLMIDIWRNWAAAEKHPIVALVPGATKHQKIGDSGLGITEHVLLGAPADEDDVKTLSKASETVQDTAIFVEISERILNACDLLIAVYGETATGHDGGTLKTVEHAGILQINVETILLPARI
jgi:voltage-gated potassium channel Kch